MTCEAVGVADLIGALERLSPLIESHRPSMEAEGRMPIELFERLREAGLFGMASPVELGGRELDIHALMTVIERAASLDASVGWAAAIGVGGGVSLAYLEPDAAREIGEGGQRFIGLSFAPTGVARPADGGLEISGCWDWCSFSDRGDWLMLNCVLAGAAPRPFDPPGLPPTVAAFVPAREVTPRGGWRALGLRGSCSQRVEVERLFVPARRARPFFGASPSIGRALYRYPPLASLTHVIAAVALGIARGALDAFASIARASRPSARGPSLAERPTTLLRFAEAEGSLLASRAHLFDEAAELWNLVEQGRAPSLVDRARARLASLEAAQSAQAAVAAVYDLAGGAAVFDASPLQRAFRDVHVLTHHYAVADDRYHGLGRALLGQVADDPFV